MEIAKNLFMKLNYVSEIPVDGRAQFRMCRRQGRQNCDVNLLHQLLVLMGELLIGNTYIAEEFDVSDVAFFGTDQFL